MNDPDRQSANSAALSGRITRQTYLLGLVFLVVITVKSLWAASRGIDIEMGDDALYLLRGVELLRDGFPSPQWAPLYVLWFFLLSRLPWLHDNVQLFYWSMIVLSVVTPLLLYVFLARARTLPVVALAAAIIYLISTANLGVKPMATRFAVLPVAIFLGAATLVPRRFHLFGLLMTLLLVSFIRPEYSLAFLATGVVALVVWLAGLRRGRISSARPGIVQVIVLGVSTLLLVLLFGNPLQGARSSVAVAQHFSINYANWTSSGADPWVVADEVAQEVFGNAGTVVDMAKANPPMFLRHLLTNAGNYPVQMIAAGFTPYLSRPVTSRLLQAVVPAALTLLVVGVVAASALINGRAHRRLPASTAPPDTSRIARLVRAWHAALGVAEPGAAHLADLAGMLWLAVSFVTVASSILVYPRPHYMPVQLFLSAALGAIITSNAVRRVLHGRRSRFSSTSAVVVAGCLGLILTPNVAGGWTWPFSPVRDYADQKNTVAAVRALDVQAPAGFLAYGATRYSFNVYLPANFRRVSSSDKNAPFLDFLRSEQIGVIIWPERLAEEPGLSQDDQYRAFIANPGAYGFAEIEVPRVYHRTNHRVLIAESLFGASAGAQVLIDLQPVSQEELRAAAEQLGREGKIEEAIDAYRRLVRLFPDDRSGHIALATALGQAGMTEETLAELDIIVQRWPGYFWAHVQRGELLAAAGQTGQAIAAFEKALELGSNDPNLLFTLGHAYRKAGLTDRAIMAFEQGLEMDPSREGARNTLQQLKASQP